MKRILIALSLASGLMAGTAQATQVFSESDEGYCQSLAGLTTTFAKERAAGETLTDLIDDVESHGFSDAVLWDVKYIVDYVFTYPHLSPSEEGNHIYSICKDGL